MANINSYMQALQGFLLVSHGSTAGAGSTLLSRIEHVSRQVVESSLNLLRTAVHGKDRPGVQLPVLVGCVWEACEAIKKTPASNRVAIGQGLTQVAVSVKDVLREMGDFEENGASDLASDSANLNAVTETGMPYDCDAGVKGEADSSDESGDLSNKLSSNEMQVVHSVKDFVSCLLSLIKQLLHIVGGTIKSSKDKSVPDTEVILWLEKILVHSKALGDGVDELGASLYPPQEMDNLQSTVEEIEGLVEQLQEDVCSLLGSMPEAFLQVSNSSKDTAASLNKVLEAVNRCSLG
ncbi:hypothetical protein KP509_17G026700 [Ceratopteris richardii]|nr:hypothetical protein KP509_17G026700 [Ceratopteris richardii]